MFSEKLQKAFNDQINAELYSEYLYLAMKSFFEEKHLKGIANWFNVQVQEEHAHALDFMTMCMNAADMWSWPPLPNPRWKATARWPCLNRCSNTKSW